MNDVPFTYSPLTNSLPLLVHKPIEHSVDEMRRLLAAVALHEQLVDLRAVLPHAGQKRPGKVDQILVAVQASAKKLVSDFWAAIRIQVVLIEHLNYNFAGTTAARHMENPLRGRFAGIRTKT